MPEYQTADPVQLLKQLIACASVTPDPAGVLDVLDRALTGLGFAVERLRFEGDGSYPVDNLFASYGSGERHLLFAGHTDVVPPGDAGSWTHPPFAAAESDGVIFGRGAVDMKSGIAAFIAAAAQAIAGGAAQGGRISLAITNDEEADAINGTEKLMAWAAQQGQRFDFALVGEPSSAARVGDSLKIGRRGSLNGEIVVTGVQGHVAYPQKASNPLPVLAKIVTALSGGLDAGTAQFPPSNLEFTSLDVGNGVSNVIPARATARLNVRYNDGFTPETLTAAIAGKLAALQDTAGGCGIAFNVVGRPSRSFVSPTAGAVETLCAAIAAETGARPELSTAGGTSDARFVAQYCPVAECGLVGTSMHQVDERVPVADVLALTAIYRRFITGFFAAPG